MAAQGPWAPSLASLCAAVFKFRGFEPAEVKTELPALEARKLHHLRLEGVSEVTPSLPAAQ